MLILARNTEHIPFCSLSGTLALGTVPACETISTSLKAAERSYHALLPTHLAVRRHLVQCQRVIAIKASLKLKENPLFTCCDSLGGVQELGTMSACDCYQSITETQREYFKENTSKRVKGPLCTCCYSLGGAQVLDLDPGASPHVGLPAATDLGAWQG